MSKLSPEEQAIEDEYAAALRITPEQHRANVRQADKRIAAEDRKAAKTAVTREEEQARLIASAQFDEQERRENEWATRHMGTLSDNQLRRHVRQNFGFDPF